MRNGAGTGLLRAVYTCSSRHTGGKAGPCKYGAALCCIPNGGEKRDAAYAGQGCAVGVFIRRTFRNALQPGRGLTEPLCHAFAEQSEGRRDNRRERRRRGVPQYRPDSRGLHGGGITGGAGLPAGAHDIRRYYTGGIILPAEPCYAVALVPAVSVQPLYCCGCLFVCVPGKYVLVKVCVFETHISLVCLPVK